MEWRVNPYDVKNFSFLFLTHSGSKLHITVMQCHGLTITITVSLCHSITNTVSHCHGTTIKVLLSLSLCHSNTLSRYHCQGATVLQYHCHGIRSPLRCRCVTVSLTRYHIVTISRSPSRCRCVTVSLTRFHIVTVSLSRCHSVTVSLSRCYRSRYLSVNASTSQGCAIIGEPYITRFTAHVCLSFHWTNPNTASAWSFN